MKRLLSRRGSGNDWLPEFAAGFYERRLAVHFLKIARS